MGSKSYPNPVFIVGKKQKTQNKKKQNKTKQKTYPNFVLFIYPKKKKKRACPFS